MDFNLWREVSFPEEIALDKIVESGQCFRPKKISPSVYRFITKHSFLYCKQVSEKKLAFYVKEEEDWEKLWRPYFDIERNYREIEKKYPEDTFLRKSIAFGRGLRVLRQDPFEMLITFILSQRKSIPAIRSSVEKLCSAFGEKVYSAVEEEEIAFFPEAEALFGKDLSQCSLGYRLPFVKDAVERVVEGRLDLSALQEKETESLLETLMEVHGVGAKVASCVALFGYSRMDISPEDVWMKRIWEKKYQGKRPYEKQSDAGIIQQYLFHYAIHHKEEF